MDDIVAEKQALKYQLDELQNCLQVELDKYDAATPQTPSEEKATQKEATKEPTKQAQNDSTVAAR